MRYTKRLILLFLLFATATTAQWRPSPYYFQYKGIKVDDTFILPLSSSTSDYLDRAGGLRYNITTNKVQVWDGALWNDLVTGSGNYINNDTTNYQNAGYSVSLPSRINYVTDTTGNRYGALEVYRTTVNPDAKAFQGIRSVFKASATEAGHEDKELTSLYGGLHITADNNQSFTNATEGLIAVAGTASNFGSGNIALLSAFGALMGNAPAATGVIAKGAFYKVTAYDVNSNPNRISYLAGFAQPRLTSGALGNVNWLSGIGDATTTGGMLGNVPWPSGNWNMYDASGFKSYHSGSLMIGDASDTTYKLKVAGRSHFTDTLRVPLVVGGLLATDKLTMRNYSSSLSPVSIDSNGITAGTTTGISGTLLNLSKVYANHPSNIVGIRSTPQAFERLGTHTFGLSAGTFQPIITGANTQNWGTSVVQGISVAPTISSGASGLISNVYAETVTRTFNSATATVDTLVYKRTYKSTESTPSTVNNEIFDLVGASGGVGGQWSRFDLTGYKSYWGTGNQLINTFTDNGLGDKLQVNGNVWASGSGRLDGNIMRVSSSANTANYTSLETSTVDGVIRANNATTGIRRALTFDGLKYTWQDVANGYNPFVIENGVAAVDSQARATIGYTAATNPAVTDSVKLFVKGNIITGSRLHAASTGDLNIIGRNALSGRLEYGIATQKDGPAGAPGQEFIIGNVPAAVASSFAKLYVGDSVTVGGGYHGIGAYDVVQSSNASLGAYAAIDSRSQLVGSTGFNHYVGVQSRPVYAGSGPISNYWYALEALGVHNGAGTVAKYAGLQVDNPQGSGPITNNYGVYIQSQTRGSSQNWNIYSETGSHYFGGTLNVNGTGSAATLTVNGGVATRIVTVTATTYSPSSIDHQIMMNNSATATVTLPDATTCSGRMYVIKKTSNNANVVNINTTASQTIDGGASTSLTTYNEFVKISSDGTNWKIQGRNTTPTLDQVTTAGATTTNNVTVGSLTIGAAFYPKLAVVTDGTTLGNTYTTVIGNTLSSACTLTLPTGGTHNERIYYIRRSSTANTLTVNTSGSDTFNGSGTSLSVTNAIIVQLQGNTWWVLAQF